MTASTITIDLLDPDVDGAVVDGNRLLLTWDLGQQ